MPLVLLVISSPMLPLTSSLGYTSPALTSAALIICGKISDAAINCGSASRSVANIASIAAWCIKEHQVACTHTWHAPVTVQMLHNKPKRQAVRFVETKDANARSCKGAVHAAAVQLLTCMLIGTTLNRSCNTVPVGLIGISKLQPYVVC